MMTRTLAFKALFLGFTLMLGNLSFAQIVQVGQGSYTTNFPVVDAAGRNGYPSGTPYVTGAAANKAVPTNEWWSHKVKNAQSSNLFNYPFTLETKSNGLVATHIPSALSFYKEVSLNTRWKLSISVRWQKACTS